jgi:transcriptional regulator NrdR family protein
MRRRPCPACSRRFLTHRGLAWHFTVIHRFRDELLRGQEPTIPR